MEFGFYLPDNGPLATPEVLSTLARHAEDAGFGILAVGDHIVMPHTMDSTYPYQDDGEYPAGHDCLEALTILTFVAGFTRRVKLLSSVIVVPYRAPVLTAKILSSLDVLSEGRLIAGIGAGWLEEEFVALGAPPFERRGAVTDEYLAAFKTLWTDPSPKLDGEFCRIDGLHFEPKPVQKPHPPIWVGGESGPARRRTAAVGDTWYPISNNPRFPLRTPEALAHSMRKVRDAAEANGRDPDAIGLAYNPTEYSLGEPMADPQGHRLPFTGSVDDLRGDIDSFAAVGVQQLVLNISGSSLDEWRLALDAFSERVMSRP